MSLCPACRCSENKNQTKKKNRRKKKKEEGEEKGLNLSAKLCLCSPPAFAKLNAQCLCPQTYNKLSVLVKDNIFIFFDAKP